MTALLPLFTVLAPLHGQEAGVVEGRVVNGSNPSSPVSSLSLEVIRLDAGMNTIRSLDTDSAGRFRLENLPVAAQLMVRAEYQDVTYHAPVVFDAGGKAQVEIRIYEATSSMEGIRLEGVRLAFQIEGDTLRSLESYAFDNQTDPPRTFVGADGGFRFYKSPDISEMPRMSVMAPGSSLPLVQPPLESADGQSYYSLYPLRPGITTFDVEQSFPYQERNFVFRKRFYRDVDTLHVGIIPADMQLAGEGLTRVEVDTQRNFAVYSGGPIEAGEEISWTLSGGTPSSSAAPRGQSRVRPLPTAVGRNALTLGPLILIGYLAVFWYAFNAVIGGSSERGSWRTRQLKQRREQLLNYLAALDGRYEGRTVDRREYRRSRELGKRQLRRIALLLGKK